MMAKPVFPDCFRFSALVFGCVSFLGAISISNAYACSPNRLTPEEIIENADHIILANAVKSKWGVSEYKSGLRHGIISFFRQLLPHDKSWRAGETKFKIRRTIKGDVENYITIHHHVSSAACGITFNAEVNYLLFVRESNKTYSVTVFSVKPFLSEGEYKDLIEMLGVSDHNYAYIDKDYFIPPDSDWLSE